MSDSILIPESLLKAVGEALAPPHPTGDVDVPRELLEVIVEYLSEDLGCDHEVGICMCGIAGLVEELNLLLAGRQQCPSCAGDGFEFSEKKYEEAIAEAAEYWKVPLGQARAFVNDFDGMTQCLTCGGAGTVSTGLSEAKK
jgi:hypothetical protein